MIEASDSVTGGKRYPGRSFLNHSWFLEQEEERELIDVRKSKISIYFT